MLDHGAHVTCRFMAERNYRGFLSEPVRLNTTDLNLDRSGSVPGGGGHSGTSAQPNGAPAKGAAKRGGPLKKSTARKPGRSSGVALGAFKPASRQCLHGVKCMIAALVFGCHLGDTFVARLLQVGPGVAAVSTCARSTARALCGASSATGSSRRCMTRLPACRQTVVARCRCRTPNPPTAASTGRR